MILKPKARYTKRDLDSLVVDSLFVGGCKTMLPEEAASIIRQSADHHNTGYSRNIESYLKVRNGNNE